MIEDIMIDIETLSVEPNALILTIAAVKFDRKTPITEYDSANVFYVRIDIDSCKKIGMHIDTSTLKWWETQSKEAKYEVFENPDRVPIREALEQLSVFLKSSKYVWANSPNFDCVILESAFKLCKLDVPWKFWNLRDCRTIYDIFRVFRNTKNTAHHALEDCKSQIAFLHKAFAKLKNANV